MIGILCRFAVLVVYIKVKIGSKIPCFCVMACHLYFLIYLILNSLFESLNVFPEALADMSMGLACSSGNASSVFQVLNTSN